MEESDRLKICTDLVIQEQGFFWRRFAGIAALHAGLLVLSTSKTIQDFHIVVNVVGIFLSLAWVYIQAVGSWYVNRYKKEFYKLIEDEIEQTPPMFGFYKRFSSTDTAWLISLGVAALWILKFAVDSSPDVMLPPDCTRL